MMSDQASVVRGLIRGRIGGWPPRTSVGLALSVVMLSLLAGCGSEVVKDELPVYCLDKPSKTACHGGKRRYFYDYRKNRCSAFNYCGGSKLFETRERCEKECVER